MTDQQPDTPWRGQRPVPPTPPLPPGATAQFPAVAANPSWWGRRTPAARALLIIAAAFLPVFLCIGGLVAIAAVSGDPPEEATAAATTPVSTPSASPTSLVETRTITETEEVPFEEVVTEDANLPEGTREVRTEGAAGLKTITYEVTITDGVETDRRRVKEEITREPVDRVVVVGTKAPEPAPEPEPVPQPPSNCDPNYAGACVPIASDVDCEGGSGDGPAYVRGPVRVVGEDVYDLDRDGDGVGCE